MLRPYKQKAIMKTCSQCQSSFEIFPEDRALLDQLAPVIGGQRFELPEPTLCPTCRIQRRIAFRNERHLYHRKSNLSGKQIISIYSPESPFKVLDQSEWWSDEWDALDHGREFDFSLPFADQFYELNLAVPHMSLYTKNTENAYYSNFTLNSKDSYLVYGCTNSENIFFSKFMYQCRDIMDSLSLFNCELCYEGIASEKCYNCQFFSTSRNCSDCLMIENCDGCKNCMMCFGLKNKEYYVLNEYVGKERFDAMKLELGDLTQNKIRMMREKFEALKSKLPHVESHLFACEDSTGDMLFNCKDCVNCFDITGAENCRHCIITNHAVSCMDVTYASPYPPEFSYELCSSTGTKNSVGCFLCWNCERTFYSIECQSCRDCFGCVGLKNKQYCIFNKQYSKEEYEILVPKIIEHMLSTLEWGEYFPIKISHFAYNETIAHEHYPLEKNEVLKRNWRWRDESETKKYKGSQVNAPESISDVSDSICDQILTCEVTGRPFKIIPQELKYYCENKLPVPRRSPDQRHLDRLASRGGYKLYERQCANCQKAIQTTYPPERTSSVRAGSPESPYAVYCQQCYLKNIY